MNDLPAKRDMTVGSRGLQLTTLSEMARFAKAVVDSGLAPRQFDTPQKVLIAIQHGAEVGLSPLHSLQSIAIINERPCLYGDALPALAWASGILEELDEWFEGEGDELTAFCRTKRRGQAKAATRSFSVADAKRAKLWGKTDRHGKPTPWVLYPQRMLQMRARSWCFRDNLADVLKGFGVREEVAEYQPIRKRERPALSLRDLSDANDPDTVEVQEHPPEDGYAESLRDQILGAEPWDVEGYIDEVATAKESGRITADEADGLSAVIGQRLSAEA